MGFLMTEAVMTVQCCFCGNQIVSIRSDPLRIVVYGDEGEQQELYAHQRCLRRAADPTVPLLFDE